MKLTLRLALTLGLLSAICGGLIVAVVTLTQERIEANRQAALKAAIYQLLPQTQQIQAQGELFASLDAQGQVIAYLIPAAGQGYQDLIRLLMAYDPHAQHLLGITILESRETPGLGDRIATDTAFLANFQALPMPLAGKHLAQPLSLARKGQTKGPGQIDGISGATVSSQAVARILNQAAERWFDQLTPQGAHE